jgi:hypothetical protein
MDLTRQPVESIKEHFAFSQNADMADIKNRKNMHLGTVCSPVKKNFVHVALLRVVDFLFS